MPKIGAHVSASGGIYKSITNAKIIGAECLQIFGASPRSWLAKGHSKEDADKFKRDHKDNKLGPVFLHAAYLVNLASSSADNRQKSIQSLIDHLNIAESIGAEGLVFHVGSGKDAPKDKAVSFIIKGIKEVLSKVKGQSKLILENDAGGGGKVGSLKEIGEIIRAVKSNRVGVCLDTAHSFESGLIDEYTKDKVKKLFDEFDKEIGIKNLTVLHVNDSKTPTGSHSDRHANIGEGLIGLQGFKNLASEKRIKNIPLVLEVPGFENMGPDKKNIDILKKLFK